MSRSRRNSRIAPAAQARIFAALGEETRLRLIGRLCGGEGLSISRLTRGSNLTRQAVTKHLKVLEKAGVVRSARRGRESVFAFEPRPIEKARAYLDGVSDQWDQALNRLKAFVEE
jgi:DNA-binding transcriptional ArsR family regulator